MPGLSYHCKIVIKTELEIVFSEDKHNLPGSEHRTHAVPQVHHVSSRRKFRSFLSPINAQQVAVAITVDDSVEQVAL